MRLEAIVGIMYNCAAGSAYIEHDLNVERDGYYTRIAIVPENEADEYLRQLGGATIYALFEDGPAWEHFISEENNLSGNWRGSQYGHFTCIGEYKTREEAEDALREVRGAS